MKRKQWSRQEVVSVSMFVSMLIWFTAALLVSPASAVDNSVCARVKLEVKQELTLERQAFDAHMRIANGFSHITLDDVDVDVSFSDDQGQSVLASSDPNNTDALFFIRLDSMENIESVDGTGSIDATSTADIHWLIIPAPGAALGVPQGTLYYVGATLTYTIGGEEHVTEVTPDYIFVKPMPELVLDYFLPTEVYGDDAFTTEIEPPVPFSLGVRVSNTGTGVAREMKIASAQPKIAENDQGLLIGFVIEECEVNGRAATLSLLADFCDIEPNEAAMARWMMTCTQSGQFVEFTATYSHSDELGGELTSLLEAVNTHSLVRDVLVDVAGRDGIRDFLAKDGGVYRVYESENTDTDVADQSASSSLTGSGNDYTLTTPVAAGFMYVRQPDPHAGQKELKGIIRSDGKQIKEENAWLSKERDGQDWNYFINLFDAGSTGTYGVAFESVEDQNQPPVLEFISDKVVLEGERVAFLVEATDPDGTYPILTAAPLPALATFADQGNGTALFDWTPAEGQAGGYGITVAASDGYLEDSQRVVIMVNSVDDTDGDGLPDDWETEHFGNLDRDGSGDYDGDGISDLDEYLSETDPEQANQAPTIPVIDLPDEGSEVTTLTPGLVIENSTDPDGDQVTYVFEVYSDQEMTILVVDEDVAEATGTTSWTVQSELSDNSWYFWRVRATDGFSFSLWTYGSFFVNTENDPPGDFQISGPVDGSEVDGLTPTLEVTNSSDPDEDPLLYAFYIYDDSDMTNLIASSPDITEGAEGHTSWLVETSLTDNTLYYWKTIVTDEHGATAETALSSFLTDTLNAAPDAPLIQSPVPGSEVALKELDLIVENATDADGDTLTYLFQLDTVDTFDTQDRQVSGEIGEGAATTSWHVMDLENDALYYWRVKASDGSAESAWTVGSFFVNTVNDSPAVPTIRNPGPGAWVDTPTPELILNPSRDPDNDSLKYRFQLYADQSLDSLIDQGETDSLNWTAPSVLANKTRYYWRAQAFDEHGGTSAWTDVADLFVKDDEVDDPPAITMLVPGEDLLTNEDSLLLRWEDTDPDTNANISLFYDTDAVGEDGTLITDQLREDPDGSGDTYLWDITGVPDETYYLYAVITDGVSSSSAYSPAAVTIDRTPPVLQVSPEPGTYGTPQSVSITSDETAEIYYSLDGSDPTVDGLRYETPIDINETTTLKAIGVDEVGNQSAVMAVTYIIQEEISVTVGTSLGRSLQGVKVYAFTETGSYTGRYATTDADGIATFSPDDFQEGNYKLRIDYLGNQFWSDLVLLPATLSIEVVIPEEIVEVVVETGSGPAEGVKVYLFSGSGSYLGTYQVTDADGIVIFYLPANKSFKVRADILGSQYWSDANTIVAGGTNDITVDAGGGIFQITLEKDPDNPMQGIKIYLFSLSGSYLGRYGTTDSSGHVEFDVPGGSYKVRADYMGYQFWSAETAVNENKSVKLQIPHKEVGITVAGRFDGTDDPLAGIRVYLFKDSGAYLGMYQTTDEDGMVSFDLPEKAYKVRADYTGQQFWSDSFTWSNLTVEVPMADAEVTVTGSGFPREGVIVYLFTAAGSYLSLNDATDTDGKVAFRVPEGEYKFRADYLGDQFWSPEETLAKDMVNQINISTGGGSFTVTALKGVADPLVGVRCYVFNEGGSYLGLFGSTDGNGEVSFDLPDGSYQFRLDYLGIQFWSDVATIPDDTGVEVLVEEEQVRVSVTYAGSAAEQVRVYLFSEGNTYLGQYGETDEYGDALFNLPVGLGFRFRADILGNQYWHDVDIIMGGGTNVVSLDAGGGYINATVQKDSGDPMGGITVYLFNDSGAYLGLSQQTDAFGAVSFRVPEGTYRLRADYMASQFWSADMLVSEDTSINLEIPHSQVDITVTGAGFPQEGVIVYAFTASGTYLGLYDMTDTNGMVTFHLPEGSYAFRVDYQGSQFWSPEWQLEKGQVASLIISVGGGTFTLHILDGHNDPIVGIKCYVFSEQGSYLGLFGSTGSDGTVSFDLSTGDYLFRMDHLGYQFWSQPVSVSASAELEENIDHQTVTISVEGELGTSIEPKEGIRVYLFNPSGSYLGKYQVTDVNGEVYFYLPEMPYEVRADYLGRQFWSGEFTWLDTTVTINEGTARTHVSMAGQDLEGVSVYVFSESGSYLGLKGTTDETGAASFRLPAGTYKFRADYQGTQNWATVDITADVMTDVVIDIAP